MLYVIDKIKRYDLYCGGKSQYIILYKDGEIKKTDDIFLKKIESEISEITKNSKIGGGVGLEKNKDKNNKNYSQKEFIKDLQKVCQPVSKPDKQKPSSNKT